MAKGDLGSQGWLRGHEDLDLAAGTNRTAELRLRHTKARRILDARHDETTPE